MPSGKDITVERFVNGVRDVRFTERIPEDHEMVVQQDDDHTHIVLGTAEELKANGVTETKPKRKSAAKKTATKPAAKRTAKK